ncbi:MAG TPA: peptide ABC transporter substrate-binding protein [Thermomicrobiaceae bacterium]|nr:peptide ABC transporter substrate-binding protein [Thermomicrobiaceae bacterium]
MPQDARFDDLMRAAAGGHLSRRALLKRAAVLGLSAPAIAALLAACGTSAKKVTTVTGTVAPGATVQPEATTATGGGQATSTSAPASPVTNPSAATPQASEASGPAGGKGDLKLLWWQAPTLLNPHVAQGTKDFDASRIVYEPLGDFDTNSKMVPQLAAEVPSLDNGMVAKDGKSVTWKLRQGVKWHDGQPFTAKDVAFTFKFVSDPKTAATTAGVYVNVDSVDVVDDYTVKVNFKQPEPAWYYSFTGANGMIIPEHVFSDYVGANSRNAPANLKPVGTGSFQIVEFKPGDVGTFKLFPDYWDKGKPHFDSITMKGGGDAASAARAALQTGESDWSWNIQVAPTVLKSMESAGKGKVVTTPGGGTERLLLNWSDPNTEVNGEKSYYKNPHPHFKVLEVRQAMANAVDRKTVSEQLYGPGGAPTGQTQNANTPYMLPDSDPAVQWKFDLKAAGDLLDKAGAAKGGDGIRTLNGRKMSWVYQTSVNEVRQKNQEIVKQALTQLGIDVQIKSVDSSVFFSGDPGNNDTYSHFYTDLEMYTNGAGIFPLNWYRRYLSADPDTDVAQKSNAWAGTNVGRYQSDAFNKLWAQAQTEIDPQKSTQLFQDMQRQILTDVAEIGIVARNGVACVSNSLTGYQTTQWASDVWDLKNWTRTS